MRRLLKRLSIFLVSMVGVVGFAQLWGIAFGTEAAPGTAHVIGIQYQETANAATLPSSDAGMRLALPVGPFGAPVSVQARVQIATWNVAKMFIVTGNGGLRGNMVIPV